MNLPEQHPPAERDPSAAVRRRWRGTIAPQSLCVDGTCTATQCCVNAPFLGNVCTSNPTGISGVTVQGCLNGTTVCFSINGVQIACV
jgi:hypothetical protein